MNDKSFFTFMIVGFVASSDYLPILSKEHGLQMVKVHLLENLAYDFKVVEPNYFDGLEISHLELICEALNIL